LSLAQTAAGIEREGAMSTKNMSICLPGKAEGRVRGGICWAERAGLAEMTNLGIRVPPGFYHTTQACVEYFNDGGHFPEGMWDQVLESLYRSRRPWGQSSRCQQSLCWSRCAPEPVSMPGMMDTVLNIGLNDDTVQGLVRKTNNRVCTMPIGASSPCSSNVVLGVPSRNLRAAGPEEGRGRQLVDTDLRAEDLQGSSASSRISCARPVQPHFPSNRWSSCGWGSNAVFSSWNVEPRVKYRQLYNIPET
jgi:pyruvate,orthophosphate dikinase